MERKGKYGKCGVTHIGTMGQRGEHWMAWYEDEDGDIKDSRYYATKEEADKAALDLLFYCEGR